MVFDGGLGNDTVTLDAGWGDETITFTANAAEIQRPGMVGQFANVEDFTVTGHVGGLGKVRFFDSAGNDNFVGAPTYAAMYGEGFYNRAWYYPEVRAEAGEGIDVAKFYDSPGNDSYVGSPTYNAVSGTGYKNEAWYFEGAHVYGTAGGVDETKFYDSPGNDTYVTTPTYAALFNTQFNANGMHGFYNRAKFFEGVHAFATAGGTDVANFYDSTANDTYVATPTYAALFNPTYREQYTNGYYNRAKFFEATHAFATAGGVDEARLYDSTANDTFYADPIQGALFNPTYKEQYTNGFYNRAKYFEGVHAFATAGGVDKAEMHDSTGDDTFVGDPTQGALFNPKYKESYTNGFYNRAKYFEEVTAFADKGGVDLAKLYDSTGDDTLNSHPTYTELLNPAYNQSYTHGFDNRVESFESVQSIGGKGGDDAANLFDSALGDLLEAETNWARLSNATLGAAFDNMVQSFSHVKAASQQQSGRRQEDRRDDRLRAGNRRPLGGYVVGTQDSAISGPLS